MPFHSEKLNWIDLRMLERASGGTGLAPGDLQQGRPELVFPNSRLGGGSEALGMLRVLGARGRDGGEKERDIRALRCPSGPAHDPGSSCRASPTL